MELATENVAFLHGSSHVDAVLSSCSGAFFAVDSVEGMYEVYAVPFAEIFENRAFVGCEIQSVPAHVRNTEAFRKAAFHAHDFAGDKAKTFVNSVFVAFLEEKLHSKADAQERFAFGNFFVNYFIKTGAEKFFGSVAKSSHTG